MKKISRLLCALLLVLTGSRVQAADSISKEFFAMDTYMSVVVNGENAEAAAEAAEAEVLRLDEEFSTGKENSDVARINRDGNGNDPGDRRAEGPFFLGV